jgi:hypothetical protein
VSDLIKRLHVSDSRQTEDAVQWLLSAQRCEVCPESINSPLEYGGSTFDGDGNVERTIEFWHSFGNATVEKETITCGTTHVAIGFVDLGTLLHAQLMTKDNQPVSSGEPIRWVGYEMSAYACAKTMVITQMLLQGAPTDTILQVSCALEMSWSL